MRVTLLVSEPDSVKFAFEYIVLHQLIQRHICFGCLFVFHSAQVNQEFYEIEPLD